MEVAATPAIGSDTAPVSDATSTPKKSPAALSEIAFRRG